MVLQVSTQRPTAQLAKAADRQAAVHLQSGTPSLQDLQAAVLVMVRELVGADIAPDVPLGAQGLDSLAAMELRQKLQVQASAPVCQD